MIDKFPIGTSKNIQSATFSTSFEDLARHLPPDYFSRETISTKPLTKPPTNTIVTTKSTSLFEAPQKASFDYASQNSQSNSFARPKSMQQTSSYPRQNPYQKRRERSTEQRAPPPPPSRTCDFRTASEQKRIAKKQKKGNNNNFHNNNNYNQRYPPQQQRNKLFGGGGGSSRRRQQPNMHAVASSVFANNRPSRQRGSWKPPRSIHDDDDDDDDNMSNPRIPKSLKRKFKSPLMNNDENKNNGNSRASSRPRRGNVRNNNNSNNASSKEDQETELPEELKGCDPKLVEMIELEIVDRGRQVKWDDIAGLAFAKRCVTEAVVLPMKRPDLFTGLRRIPKGLLLFGPPGIVLMFERIMFDKCTLITLTFV